MPQRILLFSAFHRWLLILPQDGGAVSGELYQQAQAVKVLLRDAMGWEYDLRIFGEVSEGDEDLPTLVEDVNKFYL